MKQSSLLLVFALLSVSFGCSNDDSSPEIKFSESVFNDLSGDNGKTYRVVQAANTNDPNETPINYSSCHLDDLYTFETNG